MKREAGRDGERGGGGGEEEPMFYRRKGFLCYTMRVKEKGERRLRDRER